ncbi:MAG: bifunctional phosphopantothenoylcysteine decarboxylase/phosphopantothenate--cysteine ligase CoaBC [Nevskia sp.]|nr:bifunctional phosphopantothenoylcysteine decarboxylase/phosphopantothenate--cysteine ligase CoaBC [Nevskia sp.]
MSETLSPAAAPGPSIRPEGGLPGTDLRVLLGVTGGIAAYKAAELARQFVKAGAQVQVVMTAGAQRFITAQTFQALTGRTVRSSLWDEQAEAAMGHIELARWADAIVIAPASANFLARLAQGLADDLLGTLCLASDRPLYAAPAMNRLMWANPATQANMRTLRSRGVRVIGPASGDQACGEVGEGRMSEPQGIAAEVLADLRRGIGIRDSGEKHDAFANPESLIPIPALQPLRGCRAVITAGPTREPIDPVRFISNRSSGKQGYALAEALTRLGAEVTLVSGPVHLDTPAGVRRVDVETAQQMLEATLAAVQNAHILVGAAAVADYRPAEAAAQKIKKKADTLNLALTPNSDILIAVREAHRALFIAGFAAETEKLAEHARAKLERKKLDLVAANWVGEGRAFDRDDNALQVYWDGGERALGPAAKSEVARQLAALIAERYTARRAA